MPPPPTGSSPRGRGKHGMDLQAVRVLRLIPARAGKTTFRSRTHSNVKAHPRAGGENRPAARTRLRQCGSSPRGRGKQHPDKRRASGHGLIPARAGKTTCTGRSSPSQPAHPRAGGENFRDTLMPALWSGSSPRGRGKRGRSCTPDGTSRLIPARAGKTTWCHAWRRPATAHPRAGGENRTRGVTTPGFQGSSPRGRGKLIIFAWCCGTSGLIPARAGKTTLRVMAWSPLSAHPRAGGENQGFYQTVTADDGSSPRGRGKHRRVEGHVRGRRLIPARAGKTCWIGSRMR